GAGLGETHGTLQIAIRRDFDERDASVLLVFGTQPAVIGATLVVAGAELARQAGGLVELVAVVVIHVGADEVFDQAVFGAALAKVDAPVADDDLRFDAPPAVRTQAVRGAEE